MFSLIMICLNDDNNSENSLIRMLTTLFDHNIGLTEKKAILQNEYGIKMTKQLNTEVERMCNISERYYEYGMEKGMEKGIEKGMEKGKQEEKIKIAENLLIMSTVSKEEIAKITGLDLKYVNELAEQLSPALGS